jgi:hypothetical protein
MSVMVAVETTFEVACTTDDDIHQNAERVMVELVKLSDTGLILDGSTGADSISSEVTISVTVEANSLGDGVNAAITAMRNAIHAAGNGRQVGPHPGMDGWSCGPVDARRGGTDSGACTEGADRTLIGPALAAHNVLTRGRPVVPGAGGPAPRSRPRYQTVLRRSRPPAEPGARLVDLQPAARRPGGHLAALSSPLIQPRDRRLRRSLGMDPLEAPKDVGRSSVDEQPVDRTWSTRCPAKGCKSD